MSHFEITGGAKLSGTIPVMGSKNAALPLLAACLLSRERITLHNIPEISDVDHMVQMFTAAGATISRDGSTVIVEAKDVKPERIPAQLVSSLRGSILLLGALLGRNKTATLPKPGGDIIGARPIDVHIDGFQQLGAVVTEDDEVVHIDGTAMKAGEVVLKEFSVTATENILLAAATLSGTTTINIAAAEPHVVALCELLNKMGARITGAGTHTITIQGTENIGGAEMTNIYDMLEAGFFILLGAATNSTLTITHVPTRDLLLFFKKIDDIGIRYQLTEKNEVTGEATVTIKPCDMQSFSIQTLPFPGIATDLQAPFSVIATQVTGSSLIHDPMYEGRFKYVHELLKMGANAVVCDPHRVIITGPTKLKGKRIPSLDLRAGATLLMAGLVAEGKTIIDNVEIIDRGYAHLTQRLRAIGAQIERIDDGSHA